MLIETLLLDAFVCVFVYLFMYADVDFRYSLVMKIENVAL